MKDYVDALEYFMTLMVRTGTRNLSRNDIHVYLKTSGMFVVKIQNKVVFKYINNSDSYFCMLGENTPQMRKLLRFMGIPITSHARIPTVNGVRIDPEAIYLFRDESVFPVAEFDSVPCFSAETTEQII